MIKHILQISVASSGCKHTLERAVELSFVLGRRTPIALESKTLRELPGYYGLEITSVFFDLEALAFRCNVGDYAVPEGCIDQVIQELQDAGYARQRCQWHRTPYGVTRKRRSAVGCVTAGAFLFLQREFSRHGSHTITNQAIVGDFHEPNDCQRHHYSATQSAGGCSAITNRHTCNANAGHEIRPNSSKPVIEILLMSGMVFRRDGFKQIPLLDGGASVRNLVGSIRGLRVVNRSLVGEVHFARSAASKRVEALFDDDHFSEFRLHSEPLEVMRLRAVKNGKA